MEQGRPPPASQQHCETDDDRHRHGHTRGHQSRESREQAEIVTSVDRAVVISEEQLREPEHQRTGEAKLKWLDDVLPTCAEQREQRRCGGRNPRPDAGTAHHDEQQGSRDEVEQQHH